MPVASSPSDYTTISPNYSTGFGFYTDINAVSDMLQIPAFTSATYPSAAQVGSVIKRIEGMVDEKINRSYRPIIWKNEFKDFEFSRHPIHSYYGGYVGFVQLSQMKVRKIVSLKVWEGNTYRELASAQASISLDSTGYKNLRSITLQLPNSGSSWILYYTGEGGTSANNTFNNSLGAKTTAQEICHLINEEFPSKTSQFTGATVAKFKNSEADSSIAISDFFYASVDEQDGTKVNISSLLAGEDGSDCTITLADKSGQTSNTGSVSFTDKQDMKRLGDFWMIGDDGRIFFNKKYPYHNKNSVIVSYVAGDGRVPSTVHEATTKLVAAELIRHDDQTILIAETGSNISTKEKYDLLKAEGMALIDGKKDLVYMLD
tara:strand:- start:1038 stop:2159 length:1122 start_codon:yes stop_codon:yes gene_type:complete